MELNQKMLKNDQDKMLFLGANTPDGFVGFYNNIIEMYDLKKLYILKGGSGLGKSTFIKKFASHFANESKDFFMCSGDPNSLDGVVITSLGLGVIDGTHPHAIDPKFPGIVDEIVNLGEHIDWTKIKATREQLSELLETKKRLYETAFFNLSKARETHIQIEDIYKNAVDFDALGIKLKHILSKHS